MVEEVKESVTQEVLTKYTKEEVLESAKEYFKGDVLAAEVWTNKYALKDTEGNLYEQTPDDMHRRLAREFARIEDNFPNPLKEQEIYDLLKDFKYLVPQGSPMSGIGNDFQYVSLSNCFVIGNEVDSDSYGGIMKLDQELVQLMKRRAGVGVDLSFVRPSNSPVMNSALTSTGVVPFMERFSNSTREVAQGGRRGALMESIAIDHPDSESFIDAKTVAGKVTGANVSVKISDDFMKAALSGEDYTLTYPVQSENPTHTKVVDAKRIWNKIIHNAWKSAEPGILFWDTLINDSIPDCYADLGFKTVSTNPCITGDTVISVADGRKNVTIKQLVDEGKDVPVYCLDDNNKIVIRKMRNPRITGFNKQIYKITIENGHEIRVTGNHKLLLKDGTYKRADELTEGDSLRIMTRYEASMNDVFKGSNSKSSDYVWINDGSRVGNIPEHRLIYEQLTGTKIPKGHVIHHKDFNSLNNNIDNLQCMSKVEHDAYHGGLIVGLNNPYHRMSDEWKKNFASKPGEKNGMYSGVTNEELDKHGEILTNNLKRRFSKAEWQKYAIENNLPQSFSKFRKEYFGDIGSFSKKIAARLGYENADIDPRINRSYLEALENGYDASISNNTVNVNKECEQCKSEFTTEYRSREVSFCSTSCANLYVNKNTDTNQRRTSSINDMQEEQGNIIKEMQLKIFTDLKYKLNSIPTKQEWENSCKEQNVPYRLGSKHRFKNYSEVIEEAEMYNHKVLSVELDGKEDVYNGTVDDFHNFFSGEFQEYCKNGKNKFISINQLQCGEIPLCPNDSCRLLAINLYSYVNNPFTEEATFDYDLFNKHVTIAQRLMDDLIELELEKIDKIIDKIKSDPESDIIKSTELNLWYNIKEKCEQGRRTGLGITAEGDMLAAMGITYGTKESNDFAEDLHMQLKHSAYKSSNIMAQERGTFGIWDPEREKDNPFLLRIQKEDPELYNDLVKYGRRNIALLTIAPTGSVSIMTQTTSGIEPVFMIYYTRRKKVNADDGDVRVDFTDEVGDTWQEFPVFHHKFLTYLEVNGYNIDDVMNLPPNEIDKIVAKSPYHKATANDVDWVEKVEMQGRIQKHIDHSISVTVNLPNDISEEIVAKVYETGWKSGCKGITVYRDGSRSGVLISNEDKKEDKVNKITKTTAPTRDKSLKCDIHHVTANKQKWIVIIGLLEGEPYEVFAFKPKFVHLPKTVTEGNLVRIKRGHYNLECSNGLVIENIADNFETDEQEALTRIISAALRHGTDAQFIFEQLNKSEGTITSFSKAVGRTLKKYLKDGEKGSGDCDECGAKDSLVYQEGCLSCSNCGWSKC